MTVMASGSREAFEKLRPRAQCRRWQGLRDRPGNRAGSNRQDHPSIAGRRTYCSRCRSNGACRPFRHSARHHV
ncbi:hypothetical protein M3R33_01845 [Brucella suis]|nr:hypothetical protein [Brucella suis]